MKKTCIHLRMLFPILLATATTTSAGLVLAAGEDCPMITTKDIKCPGQTEKSCGGTKVKDVPGPIDIRVCDPLSFRKVSTNAFGNKGNDGETNTQVSPDVEDKVTCTETGSCRIKLTDPTKCTSVNVVTVNHPVSPLEEVDCD